MYFNLGHIVEKQRSFQQVHNNRIVVGTKYIGQARKTRASTEKVLMKQNMTVCKILLSALCRKKNDYNVSELTC